MRYTATGLVFVSMFLLSAWPGWTQEAPTADQIVSRLMEKNSERQKELESYTSERTYRVEYHGTGGEHHGQIVVHAEYGEQGEKHLTVLSQSGSKMICDRVLRKMVETEQEASEKSNRVQMMLSPQNYQFELLGQESLDGIETWVLHVSPKVENKLTYRGRIWVSEDDFAVVRVQGEPAKNPSWWINRASFDWRYGKHGKFWLPDRSIGLSHVRIGGEAMLTIAYSAYHIVAAPDATSLEANGVPTPAQLIERSSAR